MKVPKHIAIIMDGNGRWAQRKRLPRIMGHRKGAARIKEVVREAKKLGVKSLTIFAFSTENWNRPERELKFLFNYMDKFLTNYKKELIAEDIRTKIIGRRDRINSNMVKKIKEVETATRNNKSFNLNVALDYGGRWDILEATKKLMKKYADGDIDLKDLDEDLFKKHLSLARVEEPDLLVRTSGEERISNFLIWDLAYSEFYFTKTFWPDFDKKELEKAIKSYSERERRFGNING